MSRGLGLHEQDDPHPRTVRGTDWVGRESDGRQRTTIRCAGVFNRISKPAVPAMQRRPSSDILRRIPGPSQRQTCLKGQSKHAARNQLSRGHADKIAQGTSSQVAEGHGELQGGADQGEHPVLVSMKLTSFLRLPHRVVAQT
jgi:hypothetical protein